MSTPMSYIYAVVQNFMRKVISILGAAVWWEMPKLAWVQVRVMLEASQAQFPTAQ